MFAFFPLDILQCRILLKNVDAQITPIRALPLQTTLLTHSGTLHEQETCPSSAPPTEQLQVTVLWFTIEDVNISLIKKAPGAYKWSRFNFQIWYQRNLRSVVSVGVSTECVSRVVWRGRARIGEICSPIILNKIWQVGMAVFVGREGYVTLVSLQAPGRLWINEKQDPKNSHLDKKMLI